MNLYMFISAISRKRQKDSGHGPKGSEAVWRGANDKNN